MLDPKPIVYIVDDDVWVRTSLALLIESVGWQAEPFGSAGDFLARSRVPVPSCLILDVVLPDINGFDLQAVIADRVDMPIVFVTGYGDVPATVRAMKAGAVDFFTKPVHDDALLCAVGKAIERSTVALKDTERSRAVRDSYRSLSSREREVMALVVAGRLNKQSASDLGISEITIKAHRGRIMRKMHARSLPDLVRMAVRLPIAVP